MSQLIFEERQAQLAAHERKPAKEYVTWRWYIILPLIAVTVDLFRGQLVDWHILPGGVRVVSDMAIAAMIVVVLMRMLMLDYIPQVFLVVIFATIFGVVVALFEGQPFLPTLYGWWNLFTYPLVGLYVYLMPAWPPGSARWIMRICFIAVAFQTIIQIGQYASGLRAIDYIAGTFGPHGVGQLVMFILLVSAFALGRWLSQGDWRYLTGVLFFGVVSSALGSMKMYPLAILSLSVLAIIVQLLRGRKIRRLLFVLAVLVMAVLAYSSLFDLIFGSTKGFQFQDYILDPDRSLEYLNVVTTHYSGGGFALGRISEPLLAWQDISGDPLSLLFGNGIGSDGSSRALGFAGVGRQGAFFLQRGGRSLRTFIREGGVVGLTTFAIFFALLAVTLIRRAEKNSGKDIGALQYGLFLFTLLWPLWLWYQPIWGMPVPMLVYWIVLGFVLNPVNAETQT